MSCSGIRFSEEFEWVVLLPMADDEATVVRGGGGRPHLDRTGFDWHG